MSEKFSVYEYVAVIAPGSVVVFASSLAFPELKQYIADDGVTIGGLGVFLILAFVVGHLLQAFGNLLETAVWAVFGGMPTNWVRNPKRSLLAADQLKKLSRQVAALHPDFAGLERVSKKDWFAITREIYAALQAAGKTERVDSFNRTYGLLRGIAVAFIFSTIAAIFLLDISSWKSVVLLVVASSLAIYRMYRFGVHYGRELFVQFLRL